MLPENKGRRPSKASKSSDLNGSQYKRTKRLRELSEPEVPFWAEPLPEPPEIDVVGDVQQDLKYLAFLAAVKQVAANNGQSIEEQLDIWNGMEGDEELYC